MSGLKDAGHLFRFLGLFVIAFLLFWVIRGYVVPKSFGEYGHYRGAAITDIAAHPVKFAGHQACEQCHTDIADTKTKGAHAHVNCEACHGALFQRLPAPAQPKGNLYERLVALIVPPAPPDVPLLLHADDPASVTPVKPDSAVLCARCHTASAAKPKGFPQVDPADHSNGVPCATCHNPHSPVIGSDTSATAATGGAK
ncbi:MAG: multiheme c-type cytochrome [Terracidiphilus sp.]